MVSQTQSPKPAPDTSPAPRPQGGTALSTKLLLLTFGSAVVGLVGLAFVVYQELLTTARRELQQRVIAQAEALETRLTSIQQTTQSLALGAQTLFQVGNRTPRAYDQLLQTVSASAPYVLGFGLDQQSASLVSGTTTFSSYWLTQPKPTKGTRKVEDDAYRQRAIQGASGWTEPVKVGDTLVTIFSTPVVDPIGKQEVLGVASAEVDVQTLGALPPSQGDGYWALASAEGKLLAFPSNPGRVMAGDTVQTVPELRALWTEVTGRDEGISQQGGNLFAYRKIGASQWRLLEVVPEATLRDRLLLPVLGATAGVGLLLAIVALWLGNYLKRRVLPLLEQCDRLTVERGGKPMGVMARDELEQLQFAFRKLIDQINLHEQQIKEETARAVRAEERQKIAEELQQEAEASEQEVGLLLEVVSSIEEGDLTVEAAVSDRATGLVADTLNRLRERLAETIARVLATAQQVATGAEELQVLARTVAANTVEQAESVARGTALTEQVAASAKSSAEQVKIANQALQEVQKTVESAQSAITKLTEGIAVLQKGSAQIVQRMKTLGEFVGLAEQFVQDQSQIASLTQVLAINATLVAARAAEQRDPKQFIGVAREFEAIAEQVNALATQTNQGLTLLRQRTGQIQAVVSAVDTEVQGLGGLVAGFTAGVEQSATAFQSVRQVTEQVVRVGQSVTSSSLEIANAADSTAKYMSEIATLAGQTANLTATARQKAETMGSIAQQLLAGIRFFRLPEAVLTSTDTSAVATYDIASQEVSDTLLDEEFAEDGYEYEDDTLGYTADEEMEFADSQASEEAQAYAPATNMRDAALEEFADDLEYLAELESSLQTPELEADFPVVQASETATTEVDEPITTGQSEADTFAFALGESQPESSAPQSADDDELMDFDLVLEPEPEGEVLDLDELELDDALMATQTESEQGAPEEPSEPITTGQSEADTFAFALGESQPESSTPQSADDDELMDLDLVLEPEPEGEVLDLDELELDDALMATQGAPEEPSEPITTGQSEADTFAFASAETVAQPEVQTEAEEPQDDLLLATSDASEPEIPMNSEFEALVAELEEQSPPVLELPPLGATQSSGNDSGQFAEDGFEEFVATLSEEDDGGTPFDIDSLLEEKY